LPQDKPMSTRKIAFTSKEYYHIYNRGNSKQKIFLNKADYQRFMDLLYAVNSDKRFNFSDSIKGVSVYERDAEPLLVSIGAYCLMPNHFHILITPLSDGGVTKFMQKLSTAYVMYFNEKYKRTGTLFEGKFKAEHLNTDKYLKYIFSYINLNHLKLFQKDWREVGLNQKQKAVEYLQRNKFSSFNDFLGSKRQENVILTREYFPAYFPGKEDFLAEIMTWINYSNS